MTRSTPSRDLALIALAGFVALLYVAAVVVLVLHGKVSATAVLSALAPIGTLAGFALGRLSGAPATPPRDADR